MSSTPAALIRPTRSLSHSAAPLAVWALPPLQRTPRQSPGLLHEGQQRMM